MLRLEHTPAGQGTVVIVGAGDLGGAAARQIAALDLVADVVLVDEAGKVAEGKALDIRQAAPIDRYRTSVSGTTDLTAVAQANWLVIADRADGKGEWHDDTGVALVKRITELNASAPVVCAGARQHAIIERAVLELGLPATRVLGSAPEGFRSAVMAVAALEAACDPTEISLIVAGRPPAQIVVPWDDASVGGRRATSVLSPPAITRLDARLGRLWPPGPMTLGTAAARVLRAALTRSPRAVSAFVTLGREQGRLGRAAMLPILVGPQGVRHIVSPTLTTRDHVRLETALYS